SLPDSIGESAQAAKQLPTGDTCPDGECGIGNGRGIYVEENGSFAGIDDFWHYMILSFHNINHSGRLNVRYKIPSSPPTFAVESDYGTVVSADYLTSTGKVNYSVIAVSETGTAPSWTLFDAAHNHTLVVTGQDLWRLSLNITIKYPPHPTETES